MRPQNYIVEAKFEELVEGFVTGKVGVSEGFLTAALSSSLMKNLMELNTDGRLANAGIGYDSRKTITSSIRSDKTMWIEDSTRNDAEKEFLELIKTFIAYLNRTCYTGINAYEFHYALYDQGAFYSKHKDQFKNNNSRKFSIISYLNDNWLESDGGQLIIHHEGNRAQYILPNSGKTVFFQSNELEHEVAVATRPRMSVTGWLKRV